MALKQTPAYVKNSFYLFLIQLSGYLVPILELPILSRALGPEKYGHILFANSLALLCAVFIEYGFNLYATRVVSQNREDKSVLGSLFFNIMLAKIIITFSLFLIILGFWAFTSTIDIFSPSMLGLILLFMMAYGFSPYWYFQGREKIFVISVVELSLRFGMLICLYIFINHPEDFFKAFLIQAVFGTINTSFQSFLVMKNTDFVAPKIKQALGLLKDSFHTFIFRGAQNIGNSMYTTVLGVLGSPYQVGIFSPVEKLVRAGVSFINPVATAAYPHMVSSFESDVVGAKKQGYKILGFATVLSLIGASVGFLLAGPVIKFLFTDAFSESIGVLKWLVWLIPLRIYGQYISILFLIPNKLERVSSLAIVVSLILSLILSILLIPHIGVLGVVYSVLFVEGLQALFLSFVLFKTARPF